MLKTLNLQVTEELAETINRLCCDEGMSKRQWVTRALMRALPENERQRLTDNAVRERGIAVRLKSVRSKMNLGIEVSESDKLLLSAANKHKTGEEMTEQELYAWVMGAKLTDNMIPRVEEPDDESDDAQHEEEDEGSFQ